LVPPVFQRAKRSAGATGLRLLQPSWQESYVRIGCEPGEPTREV
jgi:hypothetical protein